MPQESNLSPEDVHIAAKQGAPEGGQPTTPSAHEAGTEPSGAGGDNPATAGPGHTAVASGTPENSLGHLNPSAPEDANATPGSTSVK
jgi:hypothetical protein